MNTTLTSRIEGVISSVAVKRPVKAAASTNITLSGEQTIDGVSCVSGDRVLAYGQSTGAENGIYVVSTSAWTRADDWNGRQDVVQGTEVRVTQGTSNSGRYRVTTADDITIGTTSVALTIIAESDVTSLDQLTGDSDDIAQGTTNLYMTLAEKSKLAGIAALAEVNDDIVAGSNTTVTGGNGASWTIDAGAGATAFDDLTDVTADATVNGGIYGLQYATTGGGSYDDVLLTDTFYTEAEADTIFAAASHTHTLSDITDAGTIASQNANSVTISGGNATLTAGTFTNIVFDGTTHTATTGADTSLVSGTAGTSGNLVSWDANGDAVDSGIAVADVGTGFDTVSVTGTTKTLSLTDANTIQECSNASAQLITVPLNSSVAFPTGTEIQYEQHGAGSLAVIGAIGVSINGVDTGTVTLGEQYNGMRTRKIATDSWIAYKWTLMTSVAPPAVAASLDFDSGDFLTKSHSDWGSYNRDTFSIFGSFYLDNLSNTRGICGKRDGNVTGLTEFEIYIDTGGYFYVEGYTVGDTRFAVRSSSGGGFSTGTWYAFVIHFDTSNGTSSNRIKVWINNSSHSVTSYIYGYPDGNDIRTITQAPMSVGCTDATTGKQLIGLLYSWGFVSGSLVDVADVFDGSSGKILSTAGSISNLYALLTGSTATDDYFLTDWTNNGTVTTSATVP